MHVRALVYASKFSLIHSHSCHSNVLCYLTGSCDSSGEGLSIHLKRRHVHDDAKLETLQVCPGQ